MKNSPHKTKHKKNKAIRKANAEEPIRRDAKGVDEQVKKRTVVSKDKAKKVRSRAEGHKSHMTSPEDVDWQTEPEHIHREGKHWLQTIQKQVIDTSVRLKKKLLHRIGRGKKK